MRNTPGLFNLSRRAPYLSEGGVRTLEEVIVAPLHDSVEMGSNIGRVVYRLWQDTTWLKVWLNEWDTLPSPYNVTRSLADFLRTLKSESSRADRYYRGNESILTADELAGARIFTRPDVGCARCHNGPDLTDNGFHNVGVSPQSPDQGRYRLSFAEQDKGRFKTPSLRNLRFTAPYMHDGSKPTLSAVIDHYTSEGHPFSPQDEIRHPVRLTPREKRQLEAFLLCLSDSDFVRQASRLGKQRFP
jgi:cytochrome c peroxidase